MFCFNLRQGGLIYMDAFNLSSPHSIWDPRLLDYAEGGPNDPRTTFNDLRKWLTAVKEESKWSTNPECLFWSKDFLELVHNFLERDTRSCHRGGGKLMMLSFVSACRQNTFALNPTSICSFGGADSFALCGIDWRRKRSCMPWTDYPTVERSPRTEWIMIGWHHTPFPNLHRLSFLQEEY